MTGFVPAKFYARVQRVGDCLEWTGPRNLRGYGRSYTEGGRYSQYAHRMAWQIEIGPIPPGMDICHRCDNPPCVRIEHLFVGTRRDNMQDAKAKGRLHNPNAVKGPLHYAAKVTLETAASMQRGYAAGFNKAALARHFGVGVSTVGRVLAGAHWTAA